MATESVGILIEADDQASAKIQQAADKVEAQIKRVKDVGGQAKKSTEFISTLANTLGGTQFGAFAQQLGGLSEKISQFSEISKTGGAGAFAFKAGLAAVVATVAFKAGEAIGNVVFQTEKWAKALEDASKKAQELDAAIAEATKRGRDLQIEEIELIRDPEAKKAAYQDLFKQTQTNLIGLEARVKQQRKEVEQWNAAWFKFGNRAAYAKQANDQLAADEQRLKTATNERNELEQQLGPRREAIELAKKENAEKDKSEAYLEKLREEVSLLKATREEQIAIEAKKNTTKGDTKEAERLLREKDAIEAKKKAEEEAKKLQEDAAKQREAEAKRLDDLKKNELQRLEQQRIELEQGKEAAAAYALQMQGLDEATAKQLASEQASIDAMRVKKTGETQLQAVQSRLLTRGDGGDPSREIVENGRQLVKQQERAIAEQQRTNERLQRLIEKAGTKLDVEIVSAML